MAALAAQGAHLKPQRPFGLSVGPLNAPPLLPLLHQAGEKGRAAGTAET